MSTRATVTYGDNFHLYEECFDFRGLYLELDGTNLEYELVPNRVIVKIPSKVLLAILADADKIKERIQELDDLEIKFKSE